MNERKQLQVRVSTLHKNTSLVKYEWDGGMQGKGNHSNQPTFKHHL